jgi:AbrB family looped-hinge helix DNA binding protein
MSSYNDGACKINAIITMDAKGQVVLPKDLREKADLKPTDKIAVVAYEKEGKVCCIVMIKAERLAGAISKTLSPLLKGVIEKER